MDKDQQLLLKTSSPHLGTILLLLVVLDDPMREVNIPTEGWQDLRPGFGYGPSTVYKADTLRSHHVYTNPLQLPLMARRATTSMGFSSILCICIKACSMCIRRGYCY
jgi:hypothetical protein